MDFDRIHILGGAGAGKTTLAKSIARNYELPHRRLDDIVWADIKEHRLRSESERDRLLEEWVDSDRWVLDGIFWQPWVRPAFNRAERIVVLNLPEIKLHTRVLKRDIKLFSQAPLGNLSYFLPTLLPLLRLNRGYRTGPYREMLKHLREFEEKVVVCKTNREASEYLGVRT